jgi:HD-like signal output (HDOD) protein
MTDIDIYKKLKNELLIDLNKKDFQKNVESYFMLFSSNDIKQIQLKINNDFPEFYLNISKLIKLDLFSFNTNKEVFDFQTVLAVFGKKITYNLVLLKYYFQTLFNIKDEHIKKILYHNLTTGIIAENLNFELTGKYNFDIFLAGFYHNIGKMILISYNPGIYFTMFDEAISENLNFFEVEEKVFHYSLQTKLGVLFLRYLKFCDYIYEPIAYYRRYNKSKYKKLTALIQLSDFFSTALCVGETGDYKLPELEKNVLSEVGIKSIHIEKVFEKVKTKLLNIPEFVDLLIK